MSRRRFLRLGVAGTAWFALTGHTPYRQWKVYRQKHLLIGSCRTDPPSYPLAQRVAETLVRWLPESKARASRAPDQRRIASLLASNQWQVSVLSRGDAADLAAGRGRFEPVGSLPLHSMFAMGGHLLVCRVDFPVRHAWLVAATLTENAAAIPGGHPVETGLGTIPVHPGAQAYAAGAPLPRVPQAEESVSEPDHAHTR
jgi:hypothetical protein